MKELLLGCGNARVKRFAPSANAARDFENVTTVDLDPSCNPDVQYNLEKAVWTFAGENEFDEIHAYEVLEHLGKQGDYRSFFGTFANIYRMLKPGGHLCASCPSVASRWAWGDPGHTRIIGPEAITFLDQTEYQKQVGKTAITDYRWYWRGDFELVGHKEDASDFLFILKAHKPSRVLLS